MDQWKIKNRIGTFDAEVKLANGGTKMIPAEVAEWANVKDDSDTFIQAEWQGVCSGHCETATEAVNQLIEFLESVHVLYDAQNAAN